jgi:hypothetical protein
MYVGPVLSVMSKIPWKEIAIAAPIVMGGLDKLNKMVREWIPFKKPKLNNSETNKTKINELDYSLKRLDELEERLENLELFEKEQTDVVLKIGNQLDAVTSAIQVVSKRVNYFIILSSLSFLLALTLLILVIVK